MYTTREKEKKSCITVGRIYTARYFRNEYNLQFKMNIDLCKFNIYFYMFNKYLTYHTDWTLS